MHRKPAYFDVTVRCPLQESLLGRSAVSAGVAAAKGEEDKDAHHDELVQAAGGVFVPLVVESLGLWSAASRPVLQDIALRTTTRSGISRGLAYRHLLEQLSVCLWRHNARTSVRGFCCVYAGGPCGVFVGLCRLCRFSCFFFLLLFVIYKLN